MTLLKIDKISVPNRLKQITASVDFGERIHLIGANGAGKSSLLNVLAAELSFSGDVFLNETSIRHYKYYDLSRIQGFVIQQSEALPFMPVFHYLSLFHQLSEMNSKQLNILFHDFQIDKLLSKNIQHLSGGEWQRVRIVAVFIQLWAGDDLKGKLMLLDEPMNNLDIVQLTILDKWLDKFCQLGGSIMMSTHDLRLSYLKASKVWLISEGILIGSGTTEILLDENLLSTTFNTEIKCQNITNKVDWQVI
ncbi:ATP-binding cassette domain-containing protein [Proteus hauseri]|uniref:vitamin B12 ABC transporter ATP-binding protein BtuD n=1 Tax=Proteus hauseri TaxID=183417 RepID=UPI0010097668|nr:ATP-binding cassette domain-containing protein [Proteus hauseri]QAV24432.1 cobalamin ABC transporter ATP-binding protein [Proteus hauseri]